MQLSSLDWQFVANVATSIGALIAAVVFLWQVRSAHHEREFSVFLQFIEEYDALSDERREKWVTIKDALKNNPSEAAEVHDRQHSLGYLKTRCSQLEPLYAIEHSLLEREARSLNVLNYLCSFALKDSEKKKILCLLLANEISYYKNNLTILSEIIERERQQLLLPLIQSKSLTKISISEYFNHAK
ncbi:hypothetical protein EV700_3121 [Fluviicoccus keumensis]|uniref:Uncharacterized protein n=1 Tax=Fluviicoccus keumensis TaxID=1435465 RepID=A0A4Q7YIF5_9GAMM|nr:hypothetical protein [Fluviicoccus keumensis]RZU36908.1 hypothetical protein EV700_3121 [Fluviicoccus keumensis]